MTTVTVPEGIHGPENIQKWIDMQCEIEQLRNALKELLASYIDTQYFDPDVVTRARHTLVGKR